MTVTRILVENIIIPHEIGRSGAESDAMALSSAKKKIRRAFGCGCIGAVINNKSVDARKKSAVKLVYSVCADVKIDSRIVTEKSLKDFKLYTEAEFKFNKGTKKLHGRPVVAGFGPAGIFCALALAENGYSPIVYERGGCVADRVAAVEKFTLTGELDTSTNIQFGAGGAGTFSDGKLTTRIGDPLCAYVLSKLVELGAPEDVATKAKPHIGTDILRSVVESADLRVKELGGDVRYNSKVKLKGERISVNGGDQDYGVLVLAVGHSARDTYEELLAEGYAVEPKAFSVGVRRIICALKYAHLSSKLSSWS